MSALLAIGVAFAVVGVLGWSLSGGDARDLRARLRSDYEAHFPDGCFDCSFERWRRSQGRDPGDVPPHRCREADRLRKEGP